MGSEHLATAQPGLVAEELGQVADASARFAITGRAAEQAGLAGGRTGEAEQQLDGRRLARAVGTEEAEDLARRHAHRQAIERDRAPVALDEGVRLDGGRSAIGGRSRRGDLVGLVPIRGLGLCGLGLAGSSSAASAPSSAGTSAATTTSSTRGAWTPDDRLVRVGHQRDRRRQGQVADVDDVVEGGQRRDVDLEGLRQVGRQGADLDAVELMSSVPPSFSTANDSPMATTRHVDGHLLGHLHDVEVDVDGLALDGVLGDLVDQHRRALPPSILRSSSVLRP